jgi:putative phosphoribosyl transferase
VVNRPGALAAERPVSIAAGSALLQGDLVIPDRAAGIVIFAHGSGSSRHSRRNRYVASALQAENLATLLMDLLTSEEESIDAQTGHLRFDIELLADRLVAATDWLETLPETRTLRVGYFGASTGAGAALVAAADRQERVTAVVSRGGRPDLAGTALTRVRAPTLLVVGGRDPTVLRLNQEALASLRAEAKLEIVPGATHLFEEAGALEVVAQLAGRWFGKYLGT